MAWNIIQFVLLLGMVLVGIKFWPRKRPEGTAPAPAPVAPPAPLQGAAKVEAVVREVLICLDVTLLLAGMGFLFLASTPSLGSERGLEGLALMALAILNVGGRIWFRRTTPDPIATVRAIPWTIPIAGLAVLAIFVSLFGPAALKAVHQHVTPLPDLESRIQAYEKMQILNWTALVGFLTVMPIVIVNLLLSRKSAGSAKDQL